MQQINGISRLQVMLYPIDIAKYSTLQKKYKYN